MKCYHCQRDAIYKVVVFQIREIKPAVYPTRDEGTQTNMIVYSCGFCLPFQFASERNKKAKLHE